MKFFKFYGDGLKINQSTFIDVFYREGIWRGDPSRPVIVIDTPGLCSEDRDDDPDCDHTIASDIVKILNKFGHINAFIIVLKSGQSRYT